MKNNNISITHLRLLNIYYILMQITTIFCYYLKSLLFLVTYIGHRLKWSQWCITSHHSLVTNKMRDNITIYSCMSVCMSTISTSWYDTTCLVNRIFSFNMQNFAFLLLYMSEWWSKIPFRYIRQNGSILEKSCCTWEIYRQIWRKCHIWTTTVIYGKLGPYSAKFMFMCVAVWQMLKVFR